MATEKAISGNVGNKNNGSTITHGGTTSDPTVNVVSENKTLGVEDTGFRSAITGYTAKGISAQEFNQAPNTVAMISTDSIAGASDDVLKGGAPLPPVSNHKFHSYNMIDLSSFDMLTGTATYGANKGHVVQASGLDTTVGSGADEAANPTYAVPGEMVYQKGSNVPVQADYSARTQ